MLHEDCNKSSISLLKLQTKICQLIHPGSFEGRDDDISVGKGRVFNGDMDQLDTDNQGVEGNSKRLKPTHQQFSKSVFTFPAMSTHQPKICQDQMKCLMIDTVLANRVQCSGVTLEALRYQGKQYVSRFCECQKTV